MSSMTKIAEIPGVSRNRGSGRRVCRAHPRPKVRTAHPTGFRVLARSGVETVESAPSKAVAIQVHEVMETNPLRTRLQDLKARTEALRGYL